jgi:hypothetical protein
VQVGIAAEGKTDSLCGGTIIGMEEELVRTNCRHTDYLSFSFFSSLAEVRQFSVHCTVHPGIYTVFHQRTLENTKHLLFYYRKTYALICN